MRNILFILLINAFALNAQNSALDSIPFKLEKDNRIYTYCKVNDSDTLYFLLDTGASDMVINSERLQKVHMNFNSMVENIGTTGVSQIKLSTDNTFSWGNLKRKNTKFIAIPYPNEKWDGVLGLSVLREFVVKIDYTKKYIFLYDKQTYRNPDKNKLKLEYILNVPVVEVEIETPDNKVRKLKLEIDTGSDRILDISTKYVNDNKLLDIYKKPFAISTITSSDGNSGKIYNVFFPRIKLSKYEMYQLPGGLAQVQHGILNSREFDGMIGNWLLKRFNLTFDFATDYLYIEPNNLMYTPFYDFLTDTHL